MSRFYAQGDILLERVDPNCIFCGTSAQCIDDGSVVIAEGEATGHRHRLLGAVTMYCDDALAHDIPRGLYVAHVSIESPMALLEHEEHEPIALSRGTYRVRRQRQLEPIDDAAILED